MVCEILDQSLTPDGRPLELLREDGYFMLRVDGVPLMSNSMHRSEQTMAEVAREALVGRARPCVLIGGLGMGYTLRATLDAFGKKVEVTVAELLPEVVRYNRGVLGALNKHPLLDSRVTLFEGDVRRMLERGGWDAVLMDVDNGPNALTVADNSALYNQAGAELMAHSLAPDGVLVVWSAGPCRAFADLLESAGLQTRARRVAAHTERKAGKHVLFIGRNKRG